MTTHWRAQWIGQATSDKQKEIDRLVRISRFDDPEDDPSVKKARQEKASFDARIAALESQFESASNCALIWF
jgi:hypothetical protein